MSGKIFISYRREDSAPSAGRLCDRLSHYFPTNRIFMDVDSIDLGDNFVKTIRETVESCDVLIAVIGKGWLISCDQEGQRRLDNPDDFVRLEIATALRCDVLVIPVLVDGALMPLPPDLPNDLKTLADRNALLLSNDRFRTDSERLATAVKRSLEKTATERRERERDAKSGASRHPEFLTLPEALYLLCAHPDTGKFNTTVKYGMATAAIAELALASRVVIRGGGDEVYVDILDRSPVADLLLNSVLQNLPERPITWWWLPDTINLRVLWKHLVERGIIQERTVNTLIFFSRTVHPLCDGIRQNKLRYELAATLGQSEKRIERHLILGGICSACDQFGATFNWAPSSLWITAGERARTSEIASLAMTLARCALYERATSSTAGAS
jgi:hypothetical protein